MKDGPARDDALRRAQQLQQAHRFLEAAEAYERLLARWPDLPNAWYNLGLMQRKIGRFKAALASYQQALDRGAADPEEIHLNRGVIYADHLRQDEAAEVELTRALASNPNYVPALLNLANLNEDRGRRADALELYARLLAIDPACFEAMARYSSLMGVADRDDPILEKLQIAMQSPAAAPADKAGLGFALGALLNSIGAYEPAFAAYSAANRASRESTKDAPGYDRRGHERLVDELIAAFPLNPPREPSPARPSPAVFICGMFRSGSTLAEQMLSGHPRVTAGGELAYLPAAIAARLAPFPRALEAASSDVLGQIADRYTAAVRSTFAGADIITDKRPDNFLFIGLIKTIFPDAKIIHTVRNPLDNCLSVFFLHLDQRMAYALDLGDIGHYYRQYRRLMAHWEKLYGDDIFSFDYDAFVHAPEPRIKELLAFLSLDWDDTLLAFDKREGAVKTASVWQVRQPLNQRSSGRWRNYENELQALREELGDVLKG